MAGRADSRESITLTRRKQLTGQAEKKYTQNMRYQVVLIKTEEGYTVSCPGLPGCWSEGDTEAEALENIRDAIQEYLEAVKELHSGADIREVEVSV